MRLIILAVLLSSLSSTSCFGRLIDAKSYAELLAEAELVLIVHSKGTRLPRDGDVIVPVELDDDYLRPVITTFDVLAVLKGELSARHFSICHYEYKPGKAEIGNGPLLVRFETNDRQRIRGEGWVGMGVVGNDYVLFLKRDENQRWTFVNGQYDAKLSVRQIMNPLPTASR